MAGRSQLDQTHPADAQSLLAAIVTSSDDAIISKTLEGVILSWNGGAQRIFGYTPEEAIGQNITLVLPPERLDEEPAILKRLRRGERIDHFETVRVAKDGRRVDISLTISPVRDVAGRIIAASKVARDITASKRAEREFRERELRLQLALSAGRMGAWEWMLDSNRVIWSSSMEEIHGRPPGSFQGTFDDAVSSLHPDDRQRVVAACEEAIRTKSELSIEYRIVTPQGHERWVEARGALTDHGDGKPERMTGICMDTTHRKQAEQILLESDRRKDEFLATLAHELRNPLAPISNSLHILRMSGELSPATERVREIMERQVQQMVRLVDDLLEVSRITRNKMELRKEPVELAAILRTAVETSRPLIDDLEHQLAISVPTEPITLHADPVRLSQVIANLLNNAAKYTPRGGQIRLSARQENETAVVAVADNGLGIPADMLPLVFEMFAQVDHSIDRAQGGLGIGLTLAKSLVEMHHGTIEVRSAGLGKGSEFVVRLPLVTVNLGQVESPDVAVSCTAKVQPRKIMIVDDTRDSVFVLGKLLEKLGHHVSVNHDAEVALQNARIQRPEIVISDIAMPKMDGYEFARRVRKEPNLKGVILVALSGYGQESHRKRSKAAGFDHHLVKPVSVEVLQSLLDTLPAINTPTSITVRSGDKN